MSETSKSEKQIDVYIEEYKNGKSRDFKILLRENIESDILKGHFVRKKTVRQLAEEFGISVGTVSGFITDYNIANYDDTNIEETAILDADNHLGIMTLFFANAMYLSKEAALTSVMARKVREAIAESLATVGALETAKDTDLMRAWGEITKKTMDYSANAGKFMETYLKIMEKVLDKQRDMAFVKVMYDILQKLDPSVAERLNDALQDDEYAQAVMSSMSGEALLRVFTARSKGALTPTADYIDDILLKE